MSQVRKIVLLPGDGIGQEVIAAARKLLEALQTPLNLHFEFETHLIGGAALREYGIPMKNETLQSCQSADAVLLGAVGDPEFDNNPSHLRPEKALLGLREGIGVYCNLRPVKIYQVLLNASTLKSEIIRDVDIMVVRELTGGLYFGKPAEKYTKNGKRHAVNTMAYNEDEITRITRKAFELARLRRKKVTSVDKANVLIVSQLWRAVVEETAKEYPDVNVLIVSQLWRVVVEETARDYPDVILEHMLVDNCAMQLVRRPSQFDVLLTENMFGDIISDEASMLTGSLGMLPSASIGDGTALYEPVHGSAPDISGQNKANPIAMINSVAMMLRYTFQEREAAQAIEDSVSNVLSKGFHTTDLNLVKGKQVGTREMGDLILKETLDKMG
ncbi:MAG: 3-isopropylmalate dehydrogenase [Calditrichota bacterium]